MILIGQYDSPFVRRVGIALRLFGFGFEHRPWSVFGDAEKVAAYNPLLRVPVLVLDSGEALIESHAIIDHLEHAVPPERRLYPQSEPERHRAVRIAALACGAAEQGVSLFYELRMHKDVSQAFVDRRRGQITAGLAELETACRSRSGAYWHGDSIGHADIAVGSAFRFLAEAHPGLGDKSRLPLLTAYAAGLEALPVFREISQSFIAPA